MNNHKKIFFIFVVISLLFLSFGVYSGYTLAEIEHQSTAILTDNPQDVHFYIQYNTTSYVLRISFVINNPGPLSYNLYKIRWAVYLMNGTTQYQANNYERYYPENSRIAIAPGHSLNITIVDNTTTHQWSSWLLHQMKWQLDKYGDIKYLKWKNSLSVYGLLGNFNGEQYRYNIRTWYLWHLPEVRITYDNVIGVS